MKESGRRPTEEVRPDGLLHFSTDPDIRYLSQLSNPGSRHKRRHRPIRRLSKPVGQARITALVPENELPSGYVSTETLHLELELLGIPLSPASRSRLKADGEIVPHPAYKVVGVGRPADAWPLKETVAAIVARDRKQSMTRRAA